MTESVLQEADRLINGDRAKTYGDARQEFENVAAAWSIYLGHTLTAIDYTNMMIILKVLRARHGYHRDSYVDICGYAALGERVSAEPEPAAQPEPVDQETIDAYLRTLGFEPLGFINVDALYDGLYDAEDDEPVELDDEPLATTYVSVQADLSGFQNEFLQMMGLPRQWKSMGDIPEGIDVTDSEGDLWSAAEVNTQQPDRYGLIYADKWGPFTEVLEAKQPEPRVFRSLRDAPDGLRVVDREGRLWWGEGPDGFGYEEYGPFTEVLEGQSV